MGYRNEGFRKRSFNINRVMDAARAAIIKLVEVQMSTPAFKLTIFVGT